MKHFKWDVDHTRRFMIHNGREYRLYPYIHRQNEYERGLKYRLCETLEFKDGELRITERCKVSSIKEAEKIVNEY